jgi:hypothetical protein
MGTITSSISRIRYEFTKAILPKIKINKEERRLVLEILEITEGQCAYCGEKANGWDHLNPLVQFKRPTGFFHEARNTVPACASCNSSKSGSQWDVWMERKYKQSAEWRGIEGFDERRLRIERLEKRFPANKIPVNEIIGNLDIDCYYQSIDLIEEIIRNQKNIADKMQKRALNYVNNLGEV